MFSQATVAHAFVGTMTSPGFYLTGNRQALKVGTAKLILKRIPRG